jgi:DNA primase
LSIVKKLTKNVTLALDSDFAGEEATLRIADSIFIENMAGMEIKVATASSGKDPDEEIKADKDLWELDLKNAKSLLDFVMDTVKARFDLQTIQGKNTAVEKVLPIIEKISDPIKRAEYLRRFSLLIGVKDSYIEDVLNQKKAQQKRHKNIKNPQASRVSGSSMLFSSNKREENCLRMLFQLPELREEGLKVPPEYFENAVNLEMYLKWRENADIEFLRSAIDPAMRSCLEKLFTEPSPPVAALNENQKIRMFIDCIDLLHEQCERAKEARKQELLASEQMEGGEMAGLNKLEEEGMAEGQEMQNIFLRRKKRRQIAA